MIADRPRSADVRCRIGGSGGGRSAQECQNNKRKSETELGHGVYIKYCCFATA